MPSPLPPRADGKPADFAFGAYQRGNFLIALKEAERRIDDNSKDAAAMTLIGEIYHDGAAVGKNDLEASRWYRIASNLGDPQAAYELGVMLLAGADGVSKDPAGAKEQFERAAAKNHAAALYNLGVMALDSTNGRKPDFAAATQYFLKAANAGDDDGAYSYGVMLREGKGVPQDIAEGAHWLKRAADGGIIAGQVEYAIMLFNGEGVPKQRGRSRQDPSDRRGQGQPDRPEPPRPSLCGGPGGRARPRQGGRVERLRQGGRPYRSGARRRDSEPDPGRTQPLHQDRARDR